MAREDLLTEEQKSKPATQQDINTFMQGESYQEGGRHDLEPRGMGSGVQGPQVPRNYESSEGEEVAQESMYVQDAEAAEGQQQDQNWQQMYGRSENEKGEWRRTANEAMAELQQLRNEIAAMKSQPYGQQWHQNGQQQPGPPQQQFQPPQPVSQDALPETYFPNKNPDDIVEVKDVDAMIRSAVAPAVLQLHNQQVAMYQQQIAAQKIAVGITPVIEQRLIADNPWLAQIPEGPTRVQAMQRLMPKGPVTNEPTPRPSPKMVSPSQAASRRVTYVESGKQRSQAEGEKPLQERIAEEFYAAKTAFEKRKVLMKYGMDQVNDFGADVWSR